MTTMAALLTVGTDAATITDALRRFLQRILDLRDVAPTPETEQLINAFVTMAPAAAATFAMTTLTLNLWLAAKITATSGRLHRPRPRPPIVAPPPLTLAALCVAIAVRFNGGLLS